MKKLMIGLAAAGLCGAVFADVTSANIVGYSATARSVEPVAGKTEVYQIAGNMFVRVSDTSKFHLYDLTISGNNINTKGKRQRNYIAFMKPGTLALNSDMTYYYDNSAKKWKQKYAKTGEGGWTADSEVADFELPKNSAFMVSFYTGASDNCQLNFSGQVQEGDENGLITTMHPVGVDYTFIANPTGRDVKLSEVKFSGSSLNTKGKRQGCYVAFFKPAAMAFDSNRTYWYDTSNAAKIWKYKYANTDDGGWAADDPVADPDNIIIKAGEGVMVAFDNRCADATFEFPAPLVK